MLACPPGLFSTTTGWPICSDRRWPTTRATVSTAPPAAKGTMTLIALCGKSWAVAASGERQATASVAAAPRDRVSFAIECFMVFLRLSFRIRAP